MLSPLQIDRYVLWCPHAIWGGFLVGWLTGAIMTPVMMVAFGAMGGSFHKWRTERGLWMLAGLFFLCFGPIYALFVYESVVGALQGGAAIPGWIAVDCAVSTLILGMMVRFLWSVLRPNVHVTGDE